MNELLSIYVRLEPNKDQSNYLSSLLGSARYVYNDCLDYCIKRYKEEKLSTNLNTLSKYFHGELRFENEWLQDHNTKVMKQKLLDLEEAFNGFFKGKGYPKFKAKREGDSCRFPREAVSKKPFNKEITRLNLTRTVKNLKFSCSDEYRDILGKNKDFIRSVTVSKDKTGHFHASILMNIPVSERKRIEQPTYDSVGVDLGINTLAHLSTDEQIENPKWYRTKENKIKKLHKRLSRKKKGSKNREKARQKLAKEYKKVRNRKQTYLHRVTTKIVTENQITVIEDLNVKGMMGNRKLTKAIQEIGFAEFRRMLMYKCKWYGRNLVVIDRYFPSSKLCSKCGCKKKDLKLSDRLFECNECGLKIDRDLNAAYNIQNEGLRMYWESFYKYLVEHRMLDFKPVDNLVPEELNYKVIRYDDWSKQEEKVDN